MEIQTKYQGTIEIQDDQIIHFEQGIPGFLTEKRFVVSVFAKDTPFFILQSVDTPSLAFVVADPFHFHQDYDFDLPESVVEQLEIESEKDVAVYVVLTLQDPFESTTANLQAPLIINHHKQRGKQVVLDDSSYGTRCLLISDTSSERQEEKQC